MINPNLKIITTLDHESGQWDSKGAPRDEAVFGYILLLKLSDDFIGSVLLLWLMSFIYIYINLLVCIKLRE